MNNFKKWVDRYRKMLYNKNIENKKTYIAGNNISSKMI